MVWAQYRSPTLNLSDDRLRIDADETPSDTTTQTRSACNICEAMCVRTIEHRDREVIAIRGDRGDPSARGAGAGEFDL